MRVSGVILYKISKMFVRLNVVQDNMQCNSVITSTQGPNKLCRYKRLSL
jgi:hypothetical protein